MVQAAPSPALIDPAARIEPGVELAADVRVAFGAWVGQGAQLATGVHVGANASVLPGVSVAAHAQIREGAVVTRPVPPGAIVEGNPASIVGYVDTGNMAAPAAASTAQAKTGVQPVGVKGVTLHRFPIIRDLRGDLTVGEFERSVPFVPRRYFMVFGVPSREVRGEHAHHQCHQFLICVRGSCAVVCDDGEQRVEVLLDGPEIGLYLPPMTWGIQYKYSADALLLVFASDYYDAADYIRDYAQFKALAAKARAA
ncbi:WxcM-like domain-containing protein [Piscinibacterium candidicorallinum]|uniref:WxcM-like domain-containing protein n=1 Tax=Piscinibacterium candidicorallinum TaxID=1793872 RepID=A0ABV7H0R8_9BURK